MLLRGVGTSRGQRREEIRLGGIRARIVRRLGARARGARVGVVAVEAPRPGRVRTSSLGGRLLRQQRGEHLRTAAQRLPCGVGPAPEDAASLAQLLLERVEDGGAEDVAEQLVALRRARPEELGEAALGKHDGLRELVPAEPDDAPHLLPDLVDAREGLTPGLAVRRREAPEAHRGVLLRQACAAALGPHVLGGAADPVRARGGGEDELDLARVARRREGRAQALLGGPGRVRDGAEEGEDDGVDDGRLAGARRAGEEEASGLGEAVEVDRLRPRVGADPGHGEPVQPHEASWSVRTAS